jgi:hypothetical protein
MLGCDPCMTCRLGVDRGGEKRPGSGRLFGAPLFRIAISGLNSGNFPVEIEGWFERSGSVAVRGEGCGSLQMEGYGELHGVGLDKRENDDGRDASD